MSELTHIDETGAARMVDVSAKDVSARSAVATGRVLLSAEVVALLRSGRCPRVTRWGWRGSRGSWGRSGLLISFRSVIRSRCTG